MFYQFIKLFIAASVLLFITDSADAGYRRDYSIISAVGADIPISYGTNKISPVLYLSYWLYYTASKKSYCEIGAYTTNVFAAIGKHNEKYNFGIKPTWGHTVYGAYSDYDKGYTDSKNEVKGFYFGTEFYLNYNWSEIFSISLNYLPAYHYYTAENNANMTKPDPHKEHNAGIQLQLKKISQKNFGSIKDGFLVKTSYLYSNRTDYSFNDRIMKNVTSPEASNKPSTHRYYFDFGFYNNFENDYNIKLEVNASYQINTDRNNAEKIGSLTADRAIIPGYFFCEFYHDRYFVSNLKFGIPLPFWEARIEPAYYILYMPEKNNVTGVMNYSREYYRSIAAAFFIKIANLVPLFIDYGYGIDAERRAHPDGRIHKGSHELRAFILFAYGQT